MATLSTLVVNLTANTSDYQNQMGKVEKITRSTTQKIQTVGKVALGIGAAGFAAMAGGAFLLARKAIPAASDVVESMNAVTKVFGGSADVILDWGEQAATQAGLAQSEFFQMSAQTGAMLQNLGLDQRMAADESVNLARRAADMASIFNTDVADALGAIQAGLRGEADPLERFGVRLSQAAVKAKALEMGLLGAKGEMDDNARATAALALLYEQTDALAGDFVETSGDLANAQRVARAQVENILAVLGKMALPILGRVFNYISTVVLPILENFAKFIAHVVEEGEILGDYLQELPDWLQPIAVTIAEVIGAFQDFFGGLQEGYTVFESIWRLVYDLALAFGATEDEAVGITNTLYGLYERFIEVKNAIIEFMTPIVDWIANTVTWKDVLIALGIAIAAVVIPAIVSLLATILPVILIFGALVIAVALLRKAWESDWGGIRTWLTETWNNIIKPKLELLREWLQENIPIAIEKLRSFWEEVLRPALERFWNWIKMEVFPKLETLWKWLEENIPKAIQTLTDFWNDTLYPAIEAIWNFLTKDMMPVWEALGELLEVTVGKAIEALTGLWQNVLEPALQSIWEWIQDKIIPIFEGWTSSMGSTQEVIQKVVDWVNKLIEKIKNFQLPWWLTPKSPTPFEIGLRGIADAMDSINDRLPKMQSGFSGISRVLDDIGRKKLPVLAEIGKDPVLPIAPWYLPYKRDRSKLRGHPGDPGYRSKMEVKPEPSLFGTTASIIIYGGLHLHEVEDAESLLEELRDLST
jgi:hypothetical protein